MKIESSRDPEILSHVWMLPKGMKYNEALDFFDKRIKPRDYTFERWRYNPVSGQMVTT